MPVQEIFFPFLPALVGPVQMFLGHFFTGFVHIAQQAGQAVVPRHLSLNNYLWVELSLPQALHASLYRQSLYMPHREQEKNLEMKKDWTQFERH
jgi:hypothetical protein